jgi:heme exporter protein C
MLYFVLRGSFENQEQRARLSSVYNIFAYAAMIPLLFIIPRLSSSMHPGNGGNPGFNAYDLDSRMRMIFYPAVIAWFLVGIWIAMIRVRYRKVNERILFKAHSFFILNESTAILRIDRGFFSTITK